MGKSVPASFLHGGGFATVAPSANAEKRLEDALPDLHPEAAETVSETKQTDRGKPVNSSGGHDRSMLVNVSYIISVRGAEETQILDPIPVGAIAIIPATLTLISAAVPKVKP